MPMVSSFRGRRVSSNEKLAAKAFCKDIHFKCYPEAEEIEYWSELVAWDCKFPFLPSLVHSVKHNKKKVWIFLDGTWGHSSFSDIHTKNHMFHLPPHPKGLCI